MLSIEHHLVKRLLFKNIVNDFATKEVCSKRSQCVFFSHANEIRHIRFALQKLRLLSIIHGQLKSIKVGSDIYLIHGGDVTLGTTVGINNVWEREALFSFLHANENDRA